MVLEYHSLLLQSYKKRAKPPNISPDILQQNQPVTPRDTGGQLQRALQPPCLGRLTELSLPVYHLLGFINNIF